MTGAGIGDPGNPAWAPVPAWADGSLANCAGGITPWGTALSAEENWADYATVYGWGPDFAAENNGGYGWVMEVDPFDPDWTPRKHTNLGRLRHENATVWAREGKRLVVYTGDDARNKFLYKYVSAGSYRSVRSRRNSRLLEDGQLWVAEFAPASQDETVLSGTGRWHRVEMSPAALVDPDTWVRAQPWFNPATFPLNRPEDAEIDPFDNSLYIALTNNTDDPTAASAASPKRAATLPPTASPGPMWPSGARPGPGPGLLLSRQPGLRPLRQPVDGHRHLLQRPQRGRVRLPPQQRHLHDPGRRTRRRPGLPLRVGPQRGRVDRAHLDTRPDHHVPGHPAPSRRAPGWSSIRSGPRRRSPG